jgi:hypothetical protein
MSEKDLGLIVIDPYHHHKKILYTQIVSRLRRFKGKKFIFSFMDREREGSIFGLHSAHSIIKLEKCVKGFKVRIVKSTITKEIEIPYSFWEIFGQDNEGLLKWII